MLLRSSPPPRWLDASCRGTCRAQTNLATLSLGLLSYGFLVLSKHLAAHFRRLAPLRALAPLLLCAGSVALVSAAPGNAARWRVETVGPLPSGLPPWTAPALSLERIRRVLPSAASAAFIGFMESIAIAKSLAAQHNHTLPAGRELVSIGLANAAAACLGGYPVAGSFSRSAVANATGARTQLAGLVTSGSVLLALLCLTRCFEALPRFALAAIVISSVSALFAWRELPHLWAVKRADAGLWLLAFLGTLLLGVQQGILIAVIASLGLIVHESLTPQVAVLWRMRRAVSVYRPVKQEPDGQFVQGVLVVRIGGPLYFANVRANHTPHSLVTSMPLQRRPAALQPVPRHAERNVALPPCAPGGIRPRAPPVSARLVLAPLAGELPRGRDGGRFVAGLDRSARPWHSARRPARAQAAPRARHCGHARRADTQARRLVR